jgi:leucyl aminopeptidase
MNDLSKLDSSVEIKVKTFSPREAKPASGTYLKLVFAYDKSLASLKKDPAYPEQLWEDFDLSDREPAKGFAFHHGYLQTTAVIVFKKETKTFALHETIRKNFPFEARKTKSVILDLSLLAGDDLKRITEAVSNLIALCSHDPIRFGKKNKKEIKSSSVQLDIISSGKGTHLVDCAHQGLRQGQAANLVRTLAELPGNELGPKSYTAKVKHLAGVLAKKAKVSFEFIDEKQLKARQAHAFLAVVRATPNGPHGIIHLHYKPKKPSGKKIALVGKGLCFDTGGYNIKTEEYMFDMHRDMTGSAVTLALFKYLVESQSNHEIHAYMALAENLISPTAYRPNDVVVASNGVSIEVVDTDAEGRMVLSDTLVLACESKPDLLIDFATLTGAVIRAIDTRRSGVFSNHDQLRELAVRCGEQTGERVWGFPIGEDYWDEIHSEIADVRQCATGKNSDHIYAATFLSSFVKPEIPWLHVDLASESHKGGLGLAPKDVTGFGIRFSYSVIENFI